MSDQRPQTPIQRYRGFRVKAGVFTYGPCTRVPVDELRRLLNPDSLRLKRDQQKAREAAKATILKPWLTAQLKFYDIKFSRSATKSELVPVLREAVNRGACDAVPDHLQKLEQNLKAQYKEPYQKYKDDMAKWVSNREAKEQSKYDALDTLSDKAEGDLERFMREYFLDDAGNPDRNKTPNPLQLPGVSRAKVHARAERVDGLETVSGGTGDHRTLCIGWNRNAVWNEARNIGKEVEAQRQRAVDEAWANIMSKHESFKIGERSKVGTTRWQVANCRGQYIIECPDLEEGWECDRADFSFRIGTNGLDGLIGDFHLGVVEGVMHLSVDAAQIPHPYSCSEEDEDDEDEDTDEEGAAKLAEIAACKKRKAPGLAQKSSIKARKTEKNSLRRVHLIWRGRETGEGEIQNEDDQIGHLDFLDDAGTCFEGTMFVPFSGDAVLRGYKISAASGRIDDNWRDYSDEQYESERVGRWH
ncbi:MAG: hypothetical protein M1828_002211 [Chrysothrix sp. TS-e1954]|nr:MAG: hypothetical protein M1828_002211 [Chrysothrix sp. TS-e1954]